MCWVINKAGLGNLPNSTLELQIWLKEMWHKSWTSFYYYYFLLSPVWLENFELLSVHLLGKSFMFSSSLLLQAQEKSQASTWGQALLYQSPCQHLPSAFPFPSHRKWSITYFTHIFWWDTANFRACPVHADEITRSFLASTKYFNYFLCYLSSWLLIPTVIGKYKMLGESWSKYFPISSSRTLISSSSEVLIF